MELICDIVVKFNNDFGLCIKELGIGVLNLILLLEFLEEFYFFMMELMIVGLVIWIMLLCDGIKKMFKFDFLDLFWINLKDDVDVIFCKVKKVKIDFDVFLSEIDGLEGCLEVDNLVGIYVVFVGVIKEDVLKDFGG